MDRTKTQFHHVLNLHRKTVLNKYEANKFSREYITRVIGTVGYTSLCEDYYRRESIINSNNINTYCHLRKLLKGIYVRNSALAASKVICVPYINTEEQMKEFQHFLLNEIDSMQTKVDVYIKQIKKIYFKHRNNPSGIELSAYQCFTIFKALIITDKKNEKESDDARRELLIDLWNHSSDLDKEELLAKGVFFVSKMRHWDIPLN